MTEDRLNPMQGLPTERWSPRWRYLIAIGITGAALLILGPLGWAAVRRAHGLAPFDTIPVGNGPGTASGDRKDADTPGHR